MDQGVETSSETVIDWSLLMSRSRLRLHLPMFRSSIALPLAC